MEGNDFYKPEYFISRELSWLEFNQRVLEEAKDTKNPLLERAKFLAIVTSNLDEFFMVRVGSLKDQVEAGYTKEDAAGLTPKQQLKRISQRAHLMAEEQYNTYSRSILPQLKKEGILILPKRQLKKEDLQYLEGYYKSNIYPVLTPMAVDPGRPFPLILNRSLNIAVFLERTKEEEIFATVQVPSVLPRLIALPTRDAFVLLEDVISIFLNTLFPKQTITASACYRITRNADLTIQEEEAQDLLEEIEKSLKRRRWGQAVRLEIASDAPDEIVSYLQEALEIAERDVYSIPGPLDLGFISKLAKLEKFSRLQYAPLRPRTPRDLLGEDDIFAAIAKRDILLHHPYESFTPVVQFVEQAACDENVLAIKQTLYRVSGQSPIIRALAKAAENGKQVTVLVEVKARFDEENNIHWAKRLEQAGCHVIYGLVGLKTHCKITLVVRREEDGIKRYVHMGTGNYNDVTARLYTDMGFFTCKEAYGADASALFNSLSGYGDPPEFFKVTTAPLGLRKRFLALIHREKEHALKGQDAFIVAKMNSLLDAEIIAALYDASCAGVRIELIVRGICCLKPGIPGVSENIRVRSIVGWLLEHSRIYYFSNGGHEEIYLSSADWMPRNLDRRVELLFPVEGAAHMARLKKILEVLMTDTQKARVMNQEGGYEKVDRRGKPALNAQEYFYALAVEEERKFQVENKPPIFQPVK